MVCEYKTWKDFNNISVEVKIEDIKYNATLYVENEMLKLKVNCTKNAESINENRNIIDIINGKILKNNTKVVFINCFNYGMQHTNIGKNEYTTYSIYRIDRLILGLNLKDIGVKKFNICKIVYDDIEDFLMKKFLI